MSDSSGVCWTVWIGARLTNHNVWKGIYCSWSSPTTFQPGNSNMREINLGTLLKEKNGDKRVGSNYK